MVEVWKQEPEFKAAYDELEMEYILLRELLLARQRAGLTQAEVAEKMGTKPPAPGNRPVGPEALTDAGDTEKICPSCRLQA